MGSLARRLAESAWKLAGTRREVKARFYPRAGCATYARMSATRPAKTTWIPVTTMEEMPLLDDEELNELVGSLKEGEAEIAAGKFAVLEPRMFADEMLAIRDAARKAE